MENISYEEIGTRIKTKREELKYTKKELAEKAKISPRKLRKIEAGNSPLLLDDLIRLCDNLHLPLNYLITGQIGSRELSELIQQCVRLDPEQHKIIMRVARCWRDPQPGE